MEEGEDKHSGTNEPNWKSSHSEDNSMESADISQGDMGKEIRSVGITQGKVFEGEYNRIEKPDRTSIPVVNIQAIDEIENCKHIQEEINMRSFLKVIDGIQTDTGKSATESDCSNKILTMDTEQMVERLHTGKEGTNGASNPSVDVHPSDTAEQQRNSKEARDNQSGNQRTFIRYSSYSDEDQKGHVVTEQPNVKGSHEEPGLKAQTNTNKAEEIHRASRRGGLENYS